MATRKVNVASTELDSVVYSLDLVKMFRKVDQDIELLTVGIFSLVALNEGITNSDVQILSSVARTRKSNQGLGLLHQVLDDDDFRVRKLFLTKKGKDVKNNMLKLLG